MRRLWAVLLALLAIPAAQACSLRQYTGTAFDPLEWLDDDHLRLDRGGHDWAVLDLRDGTFASVPSKTVPDPPSGPVNNPGDPQPQGGDYRLVAVRGHDQGMMAGCYGPAQPSRPLYAYRLVRSDGSGSPLAEWTTGNESQAWSGFVWGNASQGFVWDHRAEELSAIDWANGSVHRHPVDVGDPDAYLGVFPDYPPSWGVLPDDPPQWRAAELALTGRSQVAFLDVANASARIVLSPLDVDPQGNLDGAGVADGSIFFTHWDGERTRSVARVGLDGEVSWTLTTDAEGVIHTRRGAFAVDDARHEVRVYDEGVLLATYRAADADLRPVLALRNDTVAVGIPGGSSRLVVYGPDMQLRFDADLHPMARSTTETSSPAVDGSSGPGPGPRDSPALVAPALAVVLATLGLLRRRLR